MARWKGEEKTTYQLDGLQNRRRVVGPRSENPLSQVAIGADGEPDRVEPEEQSTDHDARDKGGCSEEDV